MQLVKIQVEAGSEISQPDRLGLSVSFRRARLSGVHADALAHRPLLRLLYNSPTNDSKLFLYDSAERKAIHWSKLPLEKARPPASLKIAEHSWSAPSTGSSEPWHCCSVRRPPFMFLHCGKGVRIPGGWMRETPRNWEASFHRKSHSGAIE